MLTTTYVPGAPNWLDLGTPDTGASAAFYAAVFGWGHRSAGPEAGGYGFFEQDGRKVAGIGPLTGEGASPSWRVYFHTPDADATAKAVEQAGGSVRIAPADVFAFGRAAAFVDPTGADFAVWQPGETQGLDLVAVPGSLARTELYTTDADAAKAFYGSVFSWRTTDVPIGPALTYTVLFPAPGDASSHGGLMQLPQANLDAGSTSEWHPYFEVRDCDTTLASATEAGATVLIPATEAPGIGRFAMFLDPSGAPFAIITTARS
ncbi:VOC family protein [Streptomyces sp. NBC_00631]|uniref:VOC family protein n=1 Tax=Streptomyces sp. NBC_00631 TaxID=2975793 RepID=UPI0030E30C37